MKLKKICIKANEFKPNEFKPIEITIVLDSKAEALLFARLMDVEDFTLPFYLPDDSATSFHGDDMEIIDKLSELGIRV